MLPLSFTWLNTEFWSAVAGAVVGGALALIAQGFERRAALRERQNEKRERQKALLTHTLVKFTRMHRQLDGLVKHFDGCENRGLEGDEPWTWAQPLSALPEPSTFSTDEIGNIFMLDTALFNEVCLFEDRYQVALGSYRLFAERRENLASQFIPEQMDGIVGHLAPSDELLRRTAAARAGLNDMLPRMRLHNKADRDHASVLIGRLIALLNERFGGTLSAEFKDESSDAAVDT